MEQVPETAPMAAVYQVFINHRGPDVKKTLASLIYHSLTSYGLSVFLDKDEIHTGDSIAPAILGAIQSASVHVAIFSQHYAESSWCLEELDWILRSYHERNTKIIPVFSDVEPQHLRHIESGPYKTAFEKHQSKGRVAMEVIQKWKTALNQASMISGPLFKTGESDQGEFWKNIVDIILKEVFKREVLEVAKYPVGLDQAAENFQTKILKHCHSHATTIVGIAGMGGIGKSTLAKHFYNLRSPDFSRSSILCEFRREGLRSSQKKLLRDLLGNSTLQHIDNIAQGKRILREHLPRLRPVLIVVDDVDDVDQVESLLDVDAVASGSLILITSRDKDILRRSSAKTVVYDVKTLHKNHARELFCRHAFSQSKPSEELHGLIEEFLKICGGLPLSLKVLGGLLSGRCDKEYWEQQLQKLSTTLPNQIINPLKVSYEALGPEEKEVFLDIGCFLVGEKKELAIRVLEGLHESCRIGDYLESLHQKCLVNFDYAVQSDNEIECMEQKYPKIGYNYKCLSIRMHDQVWELARHIARQEFHLFPTRNPLRLSSSNDIEEMFRSQAGSSLEIRGIRSWEGGNNSYGQIRAAALRLFVVEHEGFQNLFDGNQNMRETSVWLRLCRFFGNNRLCRSFGNQNMWETLVWLRLYRYSFPRSLRLSYLQRLRVLEIRSSRRSVEQFFHNFDSSKLPQLNELNIVFPSSERRPPRMERRLPRATGLAPFVLGLPIRMLRPAYSIQGSSFISETSSYYGQDESYIFSYLKNWVPGFLTRLVLKNLGFLQSLPIDFSQLQNLRHLDLSGCSQLTKLPKTFSKLLQLQYLALQDCFELSLPLDILGEISTLEHVDFKGCAKLLCLPERIPYQRHLRYLNLLGTGLLELPNNLGILDKLEQITIGSPVLHEIPVSVANLRGLTELFLIQCSDLQRILPKGIAAPNIKTLAIDHCPIDDFSFQDQGNLDVQNIHVRVGMNFLRDLILTNTSISQISIPDCVSPSLETIDLSGNIQLMRVEALPSALVSLNLQNCRGLKTLTSLSNLVNLKFLNIRSCLSLKTLNMEGLASLEEIKADDCWELQRIQGLNRRERLNCLHISAGNTVIWNGICQFLTSPARQKPPSTDIFSRRITKGFKICEVGEPMLQGIAKKFNLHMLDISFNSAEGGSRFSAQNFHSHSAILMCFVTENVKSSFRVTFTPANSHDQSPKVEYSTLTGGRCESGVHVFMWTEESSLFKEYSVHTDISVLFSHDSASQARVGRRDIVVRSGVTEERGWIVMIDKKTDVSEVCREVMMAWA